MSFDKQNEYMISEYLKIIETEEIKKCDLIERSNVAVFFLTNKFIESDQFRNSWTKRKDKVILIVLLEQIQSSSFIDWNFNQLSVFHHFHDSMNLTAKEESIQRFKIFFIRLSNFKKGRLDEIPILESGQLKYNTQDMIQYGIQKMELIDNNKVMIQNIDNIKIFDWKIKEKIGQIYHDIRNIKQEFCWINHLELIFCVQGGSEGELDCLLFTINGDFVQCVYSLDAYSYKINSVSYNKNNSEVYLNVCNKSILKILILNHEFKLTKTIHCNDFANPDYPIDYISEIELLNVLYKIFHYDSNIAFLQQKTYYNDSENHILYKDVYVFDKSSYSIIGVIKGVGGLIMVSADKFIFISELGDYHIRYVIQNIPTIKSNQPDCSAYCKFKINPLKSYHLLSNPFILPCGCYGCLECILHHYNLFKQTFKCEKCEQEYGLPQQLKPLNKPIISDLFNEGFYKTFLEQNNNTILQIGNCFFRSYL
jgi:hypothetical protein